MARAGKLKATALGELHNAILFFAGVGSLVSIDGLARFRPTLSRHGAQHSNG